MRHTWDPLVPGTEYVRVDLLMRLSAIYRDTRNRDTFQYASIVEVAKLGLFSSEQIAALCNTKAYRVRDIVRLEGVPYTQTWGMFNPAGLDGLLTIALKYANDKRPDNELIERATEYAGGVLLEKLTGVPNSTYYRARKRARAMT